MVSLCLLLVLLVLLVNQQIMQLTNGNPIMSMFSSVLKGPRKESAEGKPIVGSPLLKVPEKKRERLRGKGR